MDLTRRPERNQTVLVETLTSERLIGERGDPEVRRYAPRSSDVRVTRDAATLLRILTEILSAQAPRFSHGVSAVRTL